MDRERTIRRDRPEWAWTGMRARDVATAWGDWANDMADMVDSFIDTVAPQERQRSHRPQRKRHDKPCGECAHDTCRCDCCVYDADVVVYVRWRERRVVPIRISNERTRERTITLDLSDFRTSAGKPGPIVGRIVTPTEFTLGACEHEDSILMLNVGVTATNIKELPDREILADAASLEELNVMGDVDDCLVAYADLRIQGCDVRPVRIAVAILPRDCDAYEVHCACGCC